MARRPHPSLADYAVIGISPALIMFLIGSLVFFLITVFYQGQFDVRLSFIMAMFIMAAVSVARISIERGREYASLFALPLAGVTLFAMFRFVEFSGAMARLSSILNVALIAMIWFCADKLTWDCTVIDENEDLSGKGLLQTAGMDDDQPAEATEAASDDPQETPAEVATGLWRKFVEHRRRPHAPGIWVIYFSLAALPIFGFGQLFLRDEGSRRYAFKLLVIYVGTALGLLLTTSFLGLRRYLRQRRLEMPVEMAGTWLGVGAAMIVALLLICMLMPRRSAEYSVSDLAFLNSPIDLPVSDWGIGDDGPEQDDAQRKVKRDDASEQMEGQQGEGGQTESQQGKGGDQSKSSKSGEEKSDQRSKSDQGGKGQRSSQKKKSGKNSQQKSENEQSGKQSDGKQSDGKQPDGQQPDGQQPDGQQPDEKQGKRQDETNDPDQQQDGQDSGTESQDGSDAQESEQEQSAQSRQSKTRSKSQQSQQDATSTSKTRTPPQNPFGNLSPTLGGILKVLYWVIAIGVIGFLLWKNWEQVQRAVRNFIKAMQDFWARLFGGRPREDDVEAADSKHEVVDAGRPFSDFSDPFVSGRAERSSTAELIGYTFEAFEAWGRENGCGRLAEQTPIEFAKVAARTGGLGKEALRVAELYNWTAFGKTSVPDSNRDYLRRFWQELSACAVA